MKNSQPESQKSELDSTQPLSETANLGYRVTDNTFAAALFAGAPVCGSCGKQIDGEIFWNQWGPAHLSCIKFSR